MSIMVNIHLSLISVLVVSGVQALSGCANTAEEGKGIGHFRFLLLN